MKTNTELLCEVLGWQGGTVHQVAKETGLTVEQIVNTDRNSLERHGGFSNGWLAARTCGIEHLRAVIFPKRQGDLAFWMGAASGQALKHKLGESV